MGHKVLHYAELDALYSPAPAAHYGCRSLFMEEAMGRQVS